MISKGLRASLLKCIKDVVIISDLVIFWTMRNAGHTTSNGKISRFFNHWWLWVLGSTLYFWNTHFHPRLFVSFPSLSIWSFLLSLSLDLFSTFGLFSLLWFHYCSKQSKVQIFRLRQLIWLSWLFLVWRFDVLGQEISPFLE